ncbi:hypothetical protein CCMA1212_007474 [Trichoderma ghanense]|uniref:Uncharacterized protein n=1 Tax=Trichoderma ghanense TaxID=65468 RepID=A0ABY2GXQ1_9HYPO
MRVASQSTTQHGTAQHSTDARVKPQSPRQRRCPHPSASSFLAAPSLQNSDRIEMDK